MQNFVNISTYKFAPLEDLKPLREKLIEQCKAWKLKGTILLSTEGINLFVAGLPAEIDLLLAELKAVPGLEDLKPKFSESDHQPFTRMLVRIKKEIISFGVEGIEPGKRTSPKLPAKELKKWIEEGRPFTLLDTRNDYEVKLGTFKNAVVTGIKHFRHFPEAVQKLPKELKEQPIVMFCTGGIRCEKAGPYMEREGFKHIFQLDGGILKYFEEVGGDHYDGECFVFDKRVGVDPNLQETDNSMCFLCLTPLTSVEQADPRYVEGESCPFCFKSTEEQMWERIEARQKRIADVSSPLPGSDPYQNTRPFNVPMQYSGKTLLECVSGLFTHFSKDDWKKYCDQNLFIDEDQNIVSAEHIVKSGERYFHLIPETSEPDVNADIKILYEDEALLVVNKPAPLPVHACGRYNRNTLQYILNRAYHPQMVHLAHRLDANTTGIVVLSRNRHFAGILQPQFERGEVDKVYHAKVQGHPPQDEFSCDKPVDEKSAFTAFKVLERNADGTALLEVHPKTGRTNQIREHLWALGFPICGDQVYLPDHKMGNNQSAEVGDPPLCLHAHQIAFTHPLTRKRVEFVV